MDGSGADNLCGDEWIATGGDGDDRLWDTGWNSCFDRANNQVWVYGCEPALNSQP